MVKVRMSPLPRPFNRIKDLKVGDFYRKEGDLLIKQEGGYSLCLNNFVRYQVRPTEVVEQIFKSIEILAT